MKDLEVEEGVETPQGGGGSEKPRRKKRAKRTLKPYQRCRGQLPNGWRCEAARLRHSLFCVFHDPEMQRRRAGLMELPYEHPEQVQRLLADVVERVKEGELSPKEATALGYLATLMIQNQPRIEKEKEWVKDAQFGAELQVVVDEVMEERGRKQLEAEEADEGRD